MNEFMVEECLSSGDGVTVNGVMNAGRIELGDIISVVDSMPSTCDGFVERSFNASMTVRKITAYNRDLSGLDRGVTGTLLLEGNGVALVAPRTFLRTA